MGQSESTTAWAGLLLTIPLVGLAGGCPPSECVAYNDCPSGQFCAADNTCQQLVGGDGDGDVGDAPGDGDGDGDGDGEQAAYEETLLIDGLALTDLGYSSFGDPHVVKVDESWAVLFSAFRFDPEPAEVHILQAYAASLDAPASSWTVPTAGGAVVPAFEPTGVQGDWDASVVTHPELVFGWDASIDAWVLRMFYTGYSLFDADTDDVAIGCADWNDASSAWIRCATNPVLVGSIDFEMSDGLSQVFDASVVYELGAGPDGAGGTWHMYYVGLSSDLGRLSVAHATSVDGLTWPEAQRSEVSWSGPAPASNTPSGPYGPTVRLSGGGLELFGWMPNLADLHLQGLYGTTLSGYGGTVSAGWSPLVLEDSLGDGWHYAGESGSTCHKTGLFNVDVVEDDGQRWLFYAGVGATGAGDVCAEEGFNRVSSIGRARLP